MHATPAPIGSAPWAETAIGVQPPGSTIIGGSRRIIVWDDLNPSQRLSLYDKGVDLDSSLTGDARRNALVSYRVGDMIAPALPETEALQGVVRELADSVRQHRAPQTDGAAGVRVVRILEAAGRSIDRVGPRFHSTRRRHHAGGRSPTDMSLGRVLITGGAGVVGSTIADQVVQAGATEVVVFDNLGRGRPENLAWAIAKGRSGSCRATSATRLRCATRWTAATSSSTRPRSGSPNAPRSRASRST